MDKRTWPEIMGDGYRISDLYDLGLVALNHKSVKCPKFYGGRTIPGAFAMHMHGDTLLMLFREGVYLYNPEKKKGGK